MCLVSYCVSFCVYLHVQIFPIPLGDAVITVYNTFTRFNLMGLFCFFLGRDEENVAAQRRRGHSKEAGRNPADFRGQPERSGAAPAGPQTGRSDLGGQP